MWLEPRSFEFVALKLTPLTRELEDMGRRTFKHVGCEFPDIEALTLAAVSTPGGDSGHNMWTITNEAYYS